MFEDNIYTRTDQQHPVNVPAGVDLRQSARLANNVRICVRERRIFGSLHLQLYSHSLITLQHIWHYTVRVYSTRLNKMR